jgi:hypothetical protein
MVFRSSISDTGKASIVFEAGGLYRENVAVRAGLSKTGPTIVGGTATGGNLCDDGSCSRRGARRYFLSLNQVNGAQALTACESGFHMASRWELMDLSGLEYDGSRGLSLADSGTGPPIPDGTSSAAVGWARTGGPPDSSGQGSANCSGWTDATSSSFGFSPFLQVLWGNGLQDTAWGGLQTSCNGLRHVWCIED